MLRRLMDFHIRVFLKTVAYASDLCSLFLEGSFILESILSLVKQWMPTPCQGLSKDLPVPARRSLWRHPHSAPCL